MMSLLQLITILLFAWAAQARYVEHGNESHVLETNDDDRNFLRGKKLQYCIKVGAKCGKKLPCCSKQCLDDRCVRRQTLAVEVAPTSNADAYTGLLESFAFRGKCVNLPHAADMTQLNLADCEGGNGYQQWNVKQIEQYSTTHGLIKNSNNECITVNSSPSESQNEDPVVQTECENMLGQNTNQEWKLRGTYPGPFQLECKASGRCLTVEDGGRYLDQYDCATMENAPHQFFTVLITCAKDGSRCDSNWVKCCENLFCSRDGFCSTYTQPDDICGGNRQCVSGYSCQQVSGSQYNLCKQGECTLQNNVCKTGCCAGLSCQYDNGEYYCYQQMNCRGIGVKSADCHNGRATDCCSETCNRENGHCHCSPEGWPCWNSDDCCPGENQKGVCRSRKCTL